MSSFESIMPLTWWGISALLIVILIMIVITFQLFRRLKRFEASYVTLQTFMTGNELEPMLQEYINRMTDQDEELKNCKTRLSIIEAKLRESVDRAALLRFKAFENVGGDLSFALALLNQEGNGVVLSSINGRDESRIYAKDVCKGQSSYLLSDEENQVIAKAMQGSKI